MDRVSDRNGVPDRESLRPAPSKAVWRASPQARSSPAWWISSRITKAPAARAARAWGAEATCW